MNVIFEDCYVTVVPVPGARWVRVLLCDEATGEFVQAWAYTDAGIRAGRGTVRARVWTGQRGTRVRVLSVEAAEASRKARAS